MYKLIKPLLFKLPPEFTHKSAIYFGRIIQSSHTVIPGYVKTFRVVNERLKVELFGHTFDNPVGLAAGYDKNARIIDFTHAMGFGFTEIGSVTAEPCKGNKKPRQFRLPKDNALINRNGLNNDGSRKISIRLKKERFIPVGVNIVQTPGKLGDEAINDILHTYKLLSPDADYITLNISCPNTSDGKTFEDPKSLDELLQEIKKENITIPLLIKISPDLRFGHLEYILDIGKKYNINGYIATNTSLKRENLKTDKIKIIKIGNGGLSGKPIQGRSTKVIKYIYGATNGKVPIIGVGGIDSSESAYEKIKAGASLVQLFTAIPYQGPGIVKKINEGLLSLLEKDGLKLITEAVGTN